jgi:hypothetical protein
MIQMGVVTEQRKKLKKNEDVAVDILKFIFQNQLGSDSLRIYFNNKAYDFIGENEYKVLEDIKGSTYFEYANDETVSMSFEGTFYEIINGTDEYCGKLMDKFNKILDKHGFYYEQGNAWNLSLYED